MSRLRAPGNNGEVLAIPDFAVLPALVEENRRKLDRNDVRIGELSLRELRALACDEVLEQAWYYTRWEGFGRARPEPWVNGPLLLSGHQPELSHPGVWVKNFALNGLARKLDGIPLNLVVDNDTLKSTSLHFPVLSDCGRKVQLESVPFDIFTGEVPYEDREILDSKVFAEFLPRASAIWRNWGYRPLLADAWQYVDPSGHLGCPPLGEQFANLRRRYELEWGCRNWEVSVSLLSETQAFRHFAQHILSDLPRFREVYNAAIRMYREANGVRSANHPAPELAEDEAPFWVHTEHGRRERATPTSVIGKLRPRALTLTLFARVCLGEFFIHGIGGGKYDEVTDTIIREYFGLEPPAYQVLSATLHLPLPGFSSTSDDLKRAEHRVRDLHWNPQRHLSAEQKRDPATEYLIQAKCGLVEREPSFTDHKARRLWYRELSGVTEQLRQCVADQIPVAELELSRVRAEVAANEVLRRRDYVWVLYPEETLKPFLRGFL
jgi:hypothetical protein